MNIDSKLLSICGNDKPGYAPQIDFETWRIAVLNYCEDVRPENIRQMQRHDESDEVFVLLRGHCTLIIGVGKSLVEQIHFEELQPYQLYNVKRGVWHNHILSRNASVLIVENRNTCDENSPQISLSNDQQNMIMQSYRLFSDTAL
jgi:ureidoglycolate hydrolase